VKDDRELIAAIDAEMEGRQRGFADRRGELLFRCRDTLADRLERAEGWVMVPQEPTLDMLGAWGAGLYRNMDQGSRRDAYAAMLSAAPKPEAAD
jgi:hypothetical protein